MVRNREWCTRIPRVAIDWLGWMKESGIFVGQNRRRDLEVLRERYDCSIGGFD